MRIRTIRLSGHPGVGNIFVDLTDANGNLSPVVVLAGSNGCGKTVLLESVQDVFEGKQGTERGTIELQLELDESDVGNLHVAADASVTDGLDVQHVVLTHDSSQVAARNWQTMYQLAFVCGDGNVVNGPTPLMGNANWNPVFRSLFSEASVNFSAPRLEAIRSTIVDAPSPMARRSGAKIAEEIAQLIVDIHAADSEDLAAWVKQNPGLAPPPAVQDIRFSRFLRAFEYIFPSKRFKEVRRENGLLVPEFLEFGKISSLDRLSTGEKQIVFRAGFLLRDLASLKSSVILIDEPELSLHPDWQSRIVGFYKHLLTDAEGNQPQIILATHSPFIVHGAGNSKVVILEKDNTTGVITPMPKPAYPSVAASEAVRAFNIDAFLAEASATNLLVLTEGETDKIIVETAWSKLRPRQAKPFELRAALGAKNINITLNDDQVQHKMNGRKAVGLFDFDEAYNHWNGLWKKGGTVIGHEIGGLIKKHPTAPTLWGMLLPVPAFRQNYADQSLKGNSILSIEFMFDDADHIPGLVRQKVLAAGQSQPEIVDAKKADFAAHVATLDASRFNAFEPLFQRFAEMLNGTI
jgi:predicted ATPase